LARTGLGILLLSLIGIACGKTSQNVPSTGQQAGNHAGGNGPGGVASAGSSLGGSGSTGTGATGTGGNEQLSRVDLPGVPIYTRVQRLTNTQWENAVADILLFREPHALAAQFTRPPRWVTAFDNNERILFVDSESFVDFESGAEAAAALATGSTPALAALYKGDDALGFVRTLGRRAFRRPLTVSEETKYEGVFALGERLYGAGFANGAALVIRAMLQSPHFLYRTELGPEGDPLNPYELASKLSFWLLGTTPSDALLDAAAAGKLASEDELVAIARQMLEEPRAAAVMRDFHSQLLGVEGLQNIRKERQPEYDAAINPELELASKAFFDFIFSSNFGLRELLTSTQAYVGPRLAPLYGAKPVAGDLELRDIGPSRKGYFMQIPFLVRWGEAEPNPLQRGWSLTNTVLCASPGSIESVPLPAVPPDRTNRQSITAYTEGCGGVCHRYIEPLGFALENFDSLGRERELDHGLPIDTTASFPFAEGVAQFADGAELMTIISRSAQAHTCYSKHVTSYALGRDVVESDRPLLESLAKVSLSHSLKDLVIALVRDPAFRTRKAGVP